MTTAHVELDAPSPLPATGLRITPLGGLGAIGRNMTLFEFGGRLLVADASFTVMPRHKVGIVGRNGAGKTSLFKVLGGAAEPH